MYALPVYYSYLTEKDKNQILSAFTRSRRLNVTLFTPDFETLAATAEYRLFQQSLAESHCLHHLYTPKIKDPDAMVLRKRGHNFVLPTLNYHFNSKTFIARALFNYI
jgi:hypothetical protein